MILAFVSFCFIILVVDIADTVEDIAITAYDTTGKIVNEIEILANKSIPVINSALKEAGEFV
jgi:hypothetical protein